MWVACVWGALSEPKYCKIDAHSFHLQRNAFIQEEEMVRRCLSDGLQ